MKVLVLLKNTTIVVDAANGCDVAFVSHDGEKFDSISRADIAKPTDGLTIIPIQKTTMFHTVYNLPVFYVNATGKTLPMTKILVELMPLKGKLFPSIHLLDTLHHLKASMSEMDSQSFEGMKQANDIFERGDQKWKDSEEGTMFLFNQCFEMKKINESISGTISSIDGMIESVTASMQ